MCLLSKALAMEHRMKEMAAEAEKVSRKERTEKEIRRWAFHPPPSQLLLNWLLPYWHSQCVTYLSLCVAGREPKGRKKKG